jgi:hypothetical protein
MSQPQLLSLATWIIRVVTSCGPINVDSYDAVEESLRVMAAKAKEVDHLRITDVATFAKTFWNNMYIILKYRNEIFEGIDLKKAWSATEEESPATHFSVYSGFYSFITNPPKYTKEVAAAQKVFNTLAKEFLPRTNPLKNKKLGLWYNK